MFHVTLHVQLVMEPQPVTVILVQLDCLSQQEHVGMSVLSHPTPILPQDNVSYVMAVVLSALDRSSLNALPVFLDFI